MYSTFVQAPTDTPGKSITLRALMMPNSEWQRVTMYLKKAEMEKQEKVRKFMEKEKVKAKSAAMQMEWHDSILTVQSRRIALALKRQQEHDYKERKRAKENEEFFEEERLKKLAISHQQRKYETENFRNLSKSLLFSAVLKEQQLQRELTKVIKSWDEKSEQKFVDHVLKDIAEFKKEEEDKAETRRQAKAKYKDELMLQLKTRHDFAEKQKRDLQEDENREAALTRKAGHWHEIAMQKDKQDGIDTLIHMLQEHRQIVKDVNEQVSNEETKRKKIIEVYHNVQDTLKAKIEQKQESLRRAQRQRSDKIRQGIEAEMREKAETEAKILRNSEKQEEARLDKIERARQIYDARLLKERLEAHQIHLRDKARQEEEVKLEAVMSFQQRQKREEVNQARYVELRQMDKAARQKHKECLLKQMQENRDIIQNTEDMDRAFREKNRKLLEMADEEYIKFADGVMEEAKSRGWDTGPLLRTHELEMLKMGRVLKRYQKKKCNCNY